MGGSNKSYKSSKSSEDRRDWAKERGPFRRPESPRRRSRSPFRGNNSKHHSYRPDKYRHQRYDNDLRRQLQEPRTSRDHRSPSPASQPAWKYKGSINASHFDDQPSADQLASHQSNRRRGQSVESVVHLEPIRSGPQPASHNRDGSDGRRHSKEPNGRDETPGNRTSGAPRSPRQLQSENARSGMNTGHQENERALRTNQRTHRQSGDLRRRSSLGSAWNKALGTKGPGPTSTPPQ